MTVTSRPSAATLLVLVGIATLLEYVGRFLLPLPFAPTAGDVAISTISYAAAALPALTCVWIGGHRLAGAATALAGLPFGVLAANLLFAGTYGRFGAQGLALAALAGALGGAVIARAGGRTLTVAAGVLAVTLAVRIATLPRRTADAAAPSVLLIVLDTAAADHLSLYGYPLPTTPHLTAAAGHGTVYERAVSPAPWTLPAHASIFTGRYPSALGFDGETFSYDPAIGSLAADLRDSGRTTCGLSANPLLVAFPDLQAGFEHFWGNNQLAQPLLLKAWARLRRVRDDGGFQSRGSRMTALALDWLDRLSPRRAPWFLFVNYIDPHDPYDPPAAERARFAPGIDPASVADIRAYNAGEVPITPEARAAMRGLYDGEIATVDAAVGNLLDGLEQRGFDRTNLLVIVTSDHGESLGAHGFVGHLLGMTDDVLRVPLFLTGPGVTPARIDVPVQTLQIRATVRHLLGLPEAPSAVRALPPWGEGPGLLISQKAGNGWYAEEMEPFHPPLEFGIRNGSWIALERGPLKVVLDDRGNGQTFDLATDPDEQAPRSLTDGAQLVRDYERDFPALASTGPERGPSDATRRALEAIGYIRK